MRDGFGRFYEEQAIDAELVDRIAERIASMLNGGLTAASFAKTCRIPLAAFAEQGSLYMLRMSGPSASPPANNAFSMGVTPYAASPFGVVDYQAAPFTGGFSQVNAIRQGAAGAFAYVATAWGIRSFYPLKQPRSVISAGSAITFKDMGYFNVIQITGEAWFASDHVS